MYFPVTAGTAATEARYIDIKPKISWISRRRIIRPEVGLTCKKGSVASLLHKARQQGQRAVETGDTPVSRTPEFCCLDQALVYG